MRLRELGFEKRGERSPEERIVEILRGSHATETIKPHVHKWNIYKELSAPYSGPLRGKLEKKLEKIEPRYGTNPIYRKNVKKLLPEWQPSSQNKSKK